VTARAFVEMPLDPGLGVMLTGEADEVTAQGLTEPLGPVHAEGP